MLLAPASSRPAHVQPNPKRKRPDGHNGKRTTETHRRMCSVCENPVETRAAAGCKVPDQCTRDPSNPNDHSFGSVFSASSKCQT
eukprot:g49975.t1